MTSTERRKARRAYRKTARELFRGGTLFNSSAPPGSTPWNVARWHLAQARKL